ncbi:hypothetical protein IGI04_036311 [Brassica rapa subsp. trilocularis]|uniref:Uncharacterized protein n=1 Tax=Brassica rapa subsp. trilocularis TaxID=1813537 RepID=A0ABQ7LE41_BRACM|nr:hypothetical protein IGI04_036311 [Brassica rapa subsp. trilocularis]
MIRLFNFAEIRFCVLPHRTPSNIMTSQIPFSEQVVETRLLRFCEAQNVKKGGERMAVDMLLIDGELSRFIIPVITLSPSFKFGDASVAIRFTDQTVFLKIQKQLNLFRLRVSDSTIKNNSRC